MVARARAARTNQARQIATEGYRWICRVELYCRAGYRGRAHATFRAFAALARSHPFRWRERGRGVAQSGAGGAGRGCGCRGLCRRRYKSCRLVPQDAFDLFPLCAGRCLSLRVGRCQRIVCADHETLHEQLRRQAGRLRQDMHRAARQRHIDPARDDEEEADAR